MNYYESVKTRIKELSDVEFLSEKNQSFKETLINLISSELDKSKIESKINEEHKDLIDQVKENSNIQIILNKKSDQEILDLLDELIIDFKDQNNLRKIESIEKKLIDNMDEKSYSELIRLKSQLNRE